MDCLKTDKICPLNNLKCKVCPLLDCRNTLTLLEEVEEMEQKKSEKLFRRELEALYPSCLDCIFLERLSDNKVRCSYMVNKKCIIGGFNNESKSNK